MKQELIKKNMSYELNKELESLLDESRAFLTESTQIGNTEYHYTEIELKSFYRIGSHPNFIEDPGCANSMLINKSNTRRSLFSARGLRKKELIKINGVDGYNPDDNVLDFATRRFRVW